MKKVILIILFSAAFAGGWAQNGDFSIELSRPNATVQQNDIFPLLIHTCNNGPAGNNYVANSLRITISVGITAEILGINTGLSDPRWKQLTLTSGPNNTIRITNAGGTMGGTECADIFLNVRGAVVGSSSVITGTIGFITAINPLINGGAPNATQGNTSVDNDNSLTDLTVLPLGVGASAIISAYPNPFNTRITVLGAVTGSDIMVFDIAGNLLQTSKSSGTRIDNLDLSKYAGGQYVIKVIGAVHGNIIMLKQ